MKITLTVETIPQSFEAEDEISNALQDAGLVEDLESIIESFLERMMDWCDLQVEVKVHC